MILEKLKNMRDTTFKFKTNKNTKSDHHSDKHHSHCHHQHHKHHHNSELNYYPHHSDDDYQHHHHHSESNHHHHHHISESDHQHHHHNLDSNHHHHHNDHSPHYYKEGPQYTAPYINLNQLPSPQTYIQPINVPISQPVYNHQYYGTKPQETFLSNNTNSVTNHEDPKSPTYYAHYHDRTVLTNQDKTDKGVNNYQNFRAPSEIRHIDITPITITPERVISPGKSIDDLYEKKHRFNYDNYIPISILKAEPSSKSNSSSREPPITKSVEHIVYDQQTETGHSVIAITDKEKIYYSPRAPNNLSESSRTGMNKTFAEETWFNDNGEIILVKGEDVSKPNFRQEGHLHSYYPLSQNASDGHGGGKEEQVYNYSFDDSGFADRSELSLNRSGESSYSSVTKGGKYPHRVVEAEALNKTFEDLGGTPSVFRARLDLSHFKRHEIEAKVVDDKIVVNAQHGERADPESPCGAVTKREFFTSYTLPPDCDPDKVRAYMSQNGYLTIECVRTRASGREEYLDNVPIHIK